MQLPDEMASLFTHGVTDLMFVGSDHCFLDIAGELKKVKGPYQSDAQLQRVLIELAIESGARLDIAKPMADFAIENYRVSAQLAGSVSSAPIATIRKHPKIQVTFGHLLEAEFATASQLAFLESALLESKTILITGATSTGKTTLLSAFIHVVRQRCLVIEQTPELWVEPPSVRLVERPNNQQGVGLISQSELLTQALRMRPDRLVIGEVRGAEFLALLQAVHNGHPAMATLHSKSITDVPNRLQLLGQLSGITSELVMQLAMGIDIIVQLERREGLRRIADIGKLEMVGTFEVITVEV
ncbi:MAG: CpaF family protein [Actinobacteria bacterium]|nr:CpaF family protein [Actinomycetota bacterium]